MQKMPESDSIGNQHRIWSGSPHARAYQSLSQDKGLEIARKAGWKTVTKPRLPEMPYDRRR